MLKSTSEVFLKTSAICQKISHFGVRTTKHGVCGLLWASLNMGYFSLPLLSCRCIATFFVFLYPSGIASAQRNRTKKPVKITKYKQCICRQRTNRRKLNVEGPKQARKTGATKAFFDTEKIDWVIPGSDIPQDLT